MTTTGYGPGPVVSGPAGKSAYQTWLDLGNVGTEDDFLESLEGQDGAPGASGPPGQDGEAGSAPQAYRHVQPSGFPSDTWYVQHNLGYKPGGIYAMDSAGTELKGRITHLDSNTLLIEFFINGSPAAVTGEADIS